MKIILNLLMEGYVSYASLCQQQGGLTAEAIWQELESARKGMRTLSTVSNGQDYLCLTPYVVRRQRELLSLLTHIELYYSEKRSTSIVSSVIKQTLNQSMPYQKEMLVCQELQKENCDLLLVLFCLTLLPDLLRETMCNLWKQLVIPLAPLDMSSFFVDELLHKSDFLNNDKTYLFLSFLSQAQLKFEECLLLLRRDCDDYLRMTNEPLVHRFPNLSEQQIAFFVAHREANSYYSIQEYKEFTHVCYETARNAMESFVAQGWYRQRKIGKRYYYTTVAGHS